MLYPFYCVHFFSVINKQIKCLNCLGQGVLMYVYEINEELLKELDDVKSSTNPKLEKLFAGFELGYLKTLYEKVCKELNRSYELETIETKFELDLRGDLRSRSRYQFQSGFWIGRHCVDLFFPRYRLIVEVDGWVHDTPIKMLKDEHRDDFFKAQKLFVTHIDNKNISDFAKSLVGGLRRRDLKSIDTRTKNKLMREIYIKTLVCHKEILRTQMRN